MKRDGKVNGPVHEHDINSNMDVVAIFTTLR